METGLMTAFFAGLLSFLSPCILPIVPFYLTYLAGNSVHQMAETGVVPARIWRQMVLASFAFSLGMITVFVLLGLVSTTLGQALRAYFDLLRWVAAGIVLVMGLQFLGLLRLSVLLREFGWRSEISEANSLPGAFLLGLSFAFGWTPCVGPILASILFIAAGHEGALEGGMLLFAYGLGMTAPFILAAAFVVPFLNWAKRFRSKLAFVERVTGIFLIGFAILIASDSLAVIAFWLLENMPEFAKIG